MIVLDTNVVSELMSPAVDPAVVDWVSRLPKASKVVTAVTIAEIRFGLERLPPGRRAEELRALVESVLSPESAIVLPFDRHAAEHFATVAASRQRLGRSMPVLDAQIAGICLARGLPLATRNVRDFADIGLSVIDPWATR